MDSHDSPSTVSKSPGGLSTNRIVEAPLPSTTTSLRQDDLQAHTSYFIPTTSFPGTSHQHGLPPVIPHHILAATFLQASQQHQGGNPHIVDPTHQQSQQTGADHTESLIHQQDDRELSQVVCAFFKRTGERAGPGNYKPRDHEVGAWMEDNSHPTCMTVYAMILLQKTGALYLSTA